MRQLPAPPNLKECAAGRSVLVGAGVALDWVEHPPAVFHLEFQEATARSRRRKEAENAEGRSIRLLTSAATFVGLPPAIPVGGLPAESGEPPGRPISQEGSEGAGGQIGRDSLVEESGAQETTLRTPPIPRISVVDDDEEMHLFLSDLEA